MDSTREDILEFRRLLQAGSLQRAYQALLTYMMGLRTHFDKTDQDATVSGLYQGYMDMTYFTLFPASLKDHGLKIAIVFNYDAFRFEAWLSGRNRKIQNRYWGLINGREWPGYRVIPPGTWVDSILEVDLATEFDLDDPETLTAAIETGTSAFIDEINRFLADHPPH